MKLLLRPRWLLSHLLVVAAIVAMILLGLWQLHRLDERRDHNALVEDRLAEPEVELTDLLASVGAGGAGVADLRFRQVVVVGEFATQDEILVANRTLDGAPGFWVLTPLVAAEGNYTVVVNRGFVNRSIALAGDLSVFDPPDGQVRVHGYLETSRGGGVVVDDQGIRQMSRPDLEAYAEAIGTPLSPVWIQVSESPTPLQPVPAPDIGEGPHFSYAIQWFIFTAIAVIGYPLVLRRVLRGSAERGDVAIDPELDR